MEIEDVQLWFSLQIWRQWWRFCDWTLTYQFRKNGLISTNVVGFPSKFQWKLTWWRWSSFIKTLLPNSYFPKIRNLIIHQIRRCSRLESSSIAEESRKKQKGTDMIIEGLGTANTFKIQKTWNPWIYWLKKVFSSWIYWEQTKKVNFFNISCSSKLCRTMTFI